MTDLFDYSNYKKFVRNWVSAKPKGGYGQFRRMAEHLGVGTVFISQVFNGDRHLNEEQALELAAHLHLLESEKKFFVTLVRHARAGTKNLRDHIEAELQQMRDETKQLKGRVKSEKTLSPADQAIFYSHWIYSAIRLACDIPRLRNLEALSQHLEIPLEKITEAVDFLVRTGLCENSGGELRMGPQIVFLPADSPYILSRQRSWRLRGFHRMETGNVENFFFTCPLVCSESTAKSIRQKLVKLAEEVLKEVKDSPSEALLCLNIDWFRG